tara:strand:+ start:4835 stop:5248 length:414 start_codon:yes stop_codon:yes gene_type:complete
MKNDIQLEGIKFWVDENIIYCKISTDFIIDNQEKNIEEIFYNGISQLNQRRYMPMLINMQQISSSNSIKIFKKLAQSHSVRGLILSQIFLVKSISLKVCLIVHNIIKKPFFINKICDDFNVALKYCNMDNKVFNSLS